jgi:hypothetical protein
MRKKRSESFFGIHFDFHAMPEQTVCEEYRPELIARLLDEAKPDFVQCDTKGHAGLSSYPTDIGNRASTYREDPLAMWRKLTAQRDIALYAHHSGLYDRKVAEQHPDWAVVDEDGNVSEEYLSPFSPYAEEFLIPQIKEMYDRYGIDGVWVDGECWDSISITANTRPRHILTNTKRLPPKEVRRDTRSTESFAERASAATLTDTSRL